MRDRGDLAAAYGLDADGAVLVRPDGYVARGNRSSPVEGAELGEVLRRGSLREGALRVSVSISSVIRLRSGLRPLIER